MEKTERERESEEEEGHQRLYQQCCDLVSSLPIVVEACSAADFCFHDGFFRPIPAMVGSMIVQKLFEARPTDIIMATLPKSGTTWLKALLYATVNRRNSSAIRSLTTLNPHQCVPFLEKLYEDSIRILDMDSMPSPRLLATHIPFHFLPNSIAESGCRIIYLCRNPKDNFVSLWYFINKLRKNNAREPLPLEVGFDRFCQGRSHSGPFWDHMLGYWKANLQQVEGKCNVLFMRYEELMKEPAAELKRLAEFVGCPLTQDELANGVVDHIVETCGFEKLSNLEVNKVGKQSIMSITLDNNSYFRRGVVGDWTNHLTPDMVRRIDKIIESKFESSGLAP